MTTLISPSQDAMLWALITSGAALAIWMERTWRWAARLSAPVIALLIAMTLSNTRIMPGAAPAYDVVEKWLVPLAIPLLLARANLREILRSGRGPLIAVHLAAVGSLLGTALAFFALRPWIAPPDLEHASGLMAASYIGGGVNFFAVKSTYAVDESVSGPLLVADNFVMAGAFVAFLGLAGSRWMRARFSHPHIAGAESKEAGAADGSSHAPAEGAGLFDLAKAFAFAFTVLALAFGAESSLKAAFGDVSQAGLGWRIFTALAANRFIWLTGLSLALATVLARPLSRIRGMDESGAWMLMLFLFVIGLPADLWRVVRDAPLFFVFCAIIAAANIGFTLVAGKFFRIHLEELLLAMNATLGGPPTAAAMAAGAGWPKLVLPGLLIGLWGYVIGTPLGILVVECLMALGK